MISLEVRAARHDYSVRIGEGLIQGLGALLVEHELRGRVAVVSDHHVLKAWQAKVVDALAAAQLSAEVLAVAPGEGSKSLATADALYGRLIASGFGRKDTLLTLGGGVVGDLGGFIAATYHRGMPMVQVPTTLLAQVDSSLGGKVAVNHAMGKNLIGAFYPPRLVVSDVETFSTLPTRERWNGLAEVSKAAFIGDTALLELLEAHLEAVAEGKAPTQVVLEIVDRAARLKARIVSEDEREEGARMYLNFGHTYAHALEAVTGYGPLSHGEAVVIGMRVAIRVSRKLGRLDPPSTDRILGLLGRFPRPSRLPSQPSVDRVLEALRRDKKAVGGKVRFVVLDGLCSPAVEGALTEALLREAAEWAVTEL
jgi:3-dehydroquinate synthase